MNRAMVINLILLFVGLAVYAGYGISVLYLLTVTLLSYLAGRLIPRHRWVMWVCTVLQALLLLLLRMQHRLQYPLLIAPIGISYFTLQIMAYHVDLYRGKYEPEKNILRFGLFVTWLPHIFIGPIEPYPQMRAALEERHISGEDFLKGAVRSLWGLFKKLVIAARLGVVVSAISADPELFNGAYALAAMLLYSVQLYADFSGGIDIVLGVSRMLGIRMSENFDAPYFSQSIPEFWRRWHMTLGNWLREYVYIPLGGSRKGKTRKFLNTMVTFLISGIWHGGGYILWGLLHGILVFIGDKFKTKSRALNSTVTFLLVSFLWSFFIWPDTAAVLRMTGSVFTVFNYNIFFAGISGMGLTVGDWIVLGVACLQLWLYDWKSRSMKARFCAFSPAAKVSVICLLALIVLTFGMYGIGFSASEFIYSRF
ncbi:MAG: MBOAT family protein [Lachnospiraceae bacterium]|nr:MBOAT family protein [Lachnospiraceae bacterium]